MRSVEEVKEYLENLDDSDLKTLWNNYCDKESYDDHIYDMEEFDEIASGMTPSKIARHIYYGDFCPNSDYFMFDGLANFKSGYADELVDYDGLAQYIYDNEDYLNDSDLEEFCEEE